MANLGFVLPAASIGFGSLLIRPRRGFFPFNQEGEALAPIIAQATVEEHHDDELEITEHPIEEGAVISDHAFMRPSRVIIRCAWSNSPSGPSGLISKAVGVGAALNKTVGVLAAVASTVQAAQSILSGNDQNQVRQIYKKLLALQSDRIPFDLFTGKRAYRTMLIRSLAVDTSAETENILAVTAVCQQIIIVSTQVVSIKSQSDPESTAPTKELGPKSLFTPPNFQPPNIPGLLEP